MDVLSSWTILVNVLDNTCIFSLKGQSAMSHGMDSLPAGFQSLSFGGPSYSQPGINVGPPGPALQQQPHQFSTGDSPYGRPHYVQHQLGPQAPVTQVTPLL
eukprot:m.2546 g.2546  ORF g.2546 m.2546 type:complete len:101 (+) comp8751_c0_seq2:2214-2516(+)